MLTGTLNPDGSRVQNRNPRGTIYPGIYMLLCRRPMFQAVFVDVFRVNLGA